MRRTSSNTASDPSVVFFKTVLNRAFEYFLPLMKEELLKYGKNINSETFFNTIFEDFPRDDSEYAQIITNLATISASASKSKPIVIDLCKSLLNTLSNSNSYRSFAETLIQNTSGIASKEKINQFTKYFQLIFYTDCIFAIADNAQKFKGVKYVVKTAYTLAARTTEDKIASQTCLPQWAVIMSILSKTHLNFIYEQFSNMAINKPENYFILMRYIRLESDPTVSRDFAEIMLDYINRTQRRRMLTSVMLSSVSTMLLTLNDNQDLLAKYFNIAKNKMDDPKLKYGAIELYCALYPRLNSDDEEIRDFYDKKVFPLSNDPSGFRVVVRTFYYLLVGSEVDTDWLFWFWGPEPRSNELLKIKRVTKKQLNLTKEFMTSIFKSTYFTTCSNELRDILVFLAKQDFAGFCNTVVAPFLQTEDNNIFSVFLSTLPIIEEEKEIDANLLLEFNKKVAPVIQDKLSKIVKDHTAYGIEEHVSLSEAEKAVQNIFQKWGCCNQLFISSKVEPLTNDKQGEKNDYLEQLLEVIPYFLDQTDINNWAFPLIQLAACGTSSISNPATKIIKQNLDDAEFYVNLCNLINDMITIEQKPEIIWVCLDLLKYAADGQEPKEDNTYDVLFDKLEFTAFISLASSHPEVRKKAFELLGSVNILQRNSGIMSQITRNISSIESNVKHSILYTKFNSRPDSQENKEPGHLLLQDALLSPYLQPWLYFLSEFSRMLNNYQYMIEYLIKFIRLNGKDLVTEYNHLTLGIYVILLSACSNPEYATSEQNETSDNLEKPQHYLSFDHIKDIVNTLINPRNNASSPSLNVCSTGQPLYSALYYCNPTIVPEIFKHLAQLSKLTEEFIRVSCILLRSVDELPAIKLACFDNVNTITNNVQILTKYKQKPELLLAYLSTLSLNMDTDLFVTKTENRKKTEIFSFLAETLKQTIQQSQQNTKTLIVKKPTNINEVKDPKSMSICYYISYALDELLQDKPQLDAQMIAQNFEEFLDYLNWSEVHGYNILSPLCEANLNIFLQSYIKRSFKQEQDVSDSFFSALSNAILNILSANEENDFKNIIFKNIDRILLIGIYKSKTGSTNAVELVTKLANAYAQEFFKRVVVYLEERFKNGHINDVLAQTFLKRSETFVLNALNLMLDKEFAGSIRQMCEIIKPWINNFRILPNSSSCVPNINSVVNRMTPSLFLELLTKLTSNCKKQDFESICDIWSLLLNKQEHEDAITNYLTEIPNPENEPDLKTNIFLYLLTKHDNIITVALCSRCKFSFYAYIQYQENRDIDSEMWFVPVIRKAVKRCCMNEYLPSILQFALIFHGNQTQDLLKTLCKKAKIEYSKRTLSVDEIRRFVDHFIDKLLENDQESIDRWIAEATRWVVGSKSIHNAYISLVILNEIEKHHKSSSSKNLFYGIYRSVCFFLKDVNDQKTICNYINETFALFINHFEGNEEISFQYLKIYFDFVVSVDAYFDNMIPLYKKCKDSDVTKEESSQYLLSAIKPIFNELESDSNAMKTFEDITAEDDLIDIKYVNAVIHQLNDDDNANLLEMIKKSTSNERSRALGHYSFMLLSASTDLKRRIFIVSTKILQAILQERDDIQNIFRSGKASPENSSKVSTLSTTSQLVSEATVSTEFTQDILNRIKADINKIAIFSIFKAALSKFATMQEAVQFICEVAKFDPYIATTQVVEDYSKNRWNKAIEIVISELNSKINTDNEIVTLTDCEHLESASNLLSNESKPKILPFTTQHEMIESLKNTNQSDSSPIRHIQKWVKVLTDASVALHKGINGSMLSANQKISGNYVKLEIPKEKMFSDAYILSNDEQKPVDLLYAASDFVKLGEKRLSRTPSVSRAPSNP